MIYHLFVTVSKVISSYMYVGMAAFRYSGETSSLNVWSQFFEALFFFDMMINFILSYKELGSNGPAETDLSRIAERYCKGCIHIDFIPLIPLQLIEFKNGRHNLFYLIKVFRLYHGFEIFNVPRVMNAFKKIYKKRALDMIENDPITA